MGIDFALACGDCFEFIDLHKWSIDEDAGNCLVTAHKLSYSGDRNKPSQRVERLSNQPIVSVTSQQLIDSLDNFVPHQIYIKELLPFVHNFITFHQGHFMFFTCDIGEYPWNFGEPQCFEWREVQAIFNYSSQFLPKNLIEDFGFNHWKEVLQYYSKHQSWFLHQQMSNEREALRIAFEQRLTLLHDK